jgi:tetratricopeptide (TPR) repeat protein
MTGAQTAPIDGLSARILESFPRLLTTRRAIFLLIAAGFVLFLNSLGNGFVGDDYSQILSNNLLHSWANIPSIFGGTTSVTNLGNGVPVSVAADYYRPLPEAFYSIIYSLFGANAFAFHFFQVANYTASAVLGFLLLKKFARVDLAFLLAIIYLALPINNDLATSISNYQQDFLFGIWAVLVATSRDSRFKNAAVFFLLILSLLSKETGLCFVLIILSYYAIYDIRWKTSRFKSSLPYAVVIVTLYLVVRFHVAGHAPAVAQFQMQRLPLSERLLSVPAMVTYYLSTFFYPKDLALLYDWSVTSPTFVDFYLPLLVLIVLSFAAFYIGNSIRKTSPTRFGAYVFFFLWFVFGLGLHIQIIPLDGTVSPEWFHIPGFGLLGMIAVALEHFVPQQGRVRLAVLGLILLVAIGYVGRSVVRNTDWKDDQTLMCHDAGVAEVWALEDRCGLNLAVAGDHVDAVDHLRRSVQLAPYPYNNWYDLGQVLVADAEASKSRPLLDEAEHALLTAITIDPQNPLAYDKLGYVLAVYESHDAAKAFLTPIVQQYPNDYNLWLYLAVTDYAHGDTKDAVLEIGNAYALNPNDQRISGVYSAIANHAPLNLPTM